MSVLAKNYNKATNELFIKGAPEYIVKNSTKILTKSGKTVALKENTK